MATDPTPPIFVRDGDGKRRVLTTWYDDGGTRRAHRVTEPDGSVPRTRSRANQLWDDWRRNVWARRLDARNPGSEVFTVARLCWRYLLHCTRTCRKRGKVTSHVWNIRCALRALRDAHGPEPADALDAPKLAKVRDGMVWKPDGNPRAASTVNGRLAALQAAFAWARERGLVSAATAADVLLVRPVRPARRGVPGPKPARKVGSVDRATVDATVGRMPATTRDMVDLLWWSGMRPGEVCDVRGCDLLTSGDDWLYCPEYYKTDHMEQAPRRVVALGPHARAIVARHLTTDLARPLFRPADAMADHLTRRAMSRTTPPRSGNRPGSNRVADPARTPGGLYTAATLRRAVHYACDAAGVPRWNPNQLRHAAATRIERAAGRDAARAVLGHTSARTTDVYLDPDVQQAIRVAREVG